MSVLYQALGTFIVCYIRMNLALTFSWPAFTTALFKSDVTPLHRPMTGFEAALFGSMLSVGTLIFTPILGLLLDVLGRRKCMILAALSHVVAWSIIVLSNRVEALLAAMFLAGASTASFVVIPVYIAEICQASVRGTMSSCMMLAFSLGMLVSYLLGGYLQYSLMCYICLALVSLGAVMTFTLTESPVFLMKKGREEEAIQAIAYYRNTSKDSHIVMQEIDNIRKTLEGAEELPVKEEISKKQTLQEMEAVPNKEDSVKPAEKQSFWEFFKSSRSTRKASVLALMLLTCSIFHGYVAVCVYAGDLFQEAVKNLSPVICSVLTAIISIAANLLSAYLIDVLGRRPLMIYSSLGTGLCCVLLGSQIQLQWGPHIMSAIAIFMFCFIYTLGAGAVPFVLAGEVFLPEVSSIMSMVSYELTWLCSFIILFAFGPLVSVFGLGGLFYLFAIICFATVGYAAYFLPETKGLTVDAIQKLF